MFFRNEYLISAFVNSSNEATNLINIAVESLLIVNNLFQKANKPKDEEKKNSSDGI